MKDGHTGRNAVLTRHHKVELANNKQTTVTMKPHPKMLYVSHEMRCSTGCFLSAHRKVRLYLPIYLFIYVFQGSRVGSLLYLEIKKLTTIRVFDCT